MEESRLVSNKLKRSFYQPNLELLGNVNLQVLTGEISTCPGNNIKERKRENIHLFGQEIQTGRSGENESCTDLDQERIMKSGSPKKLRREL